VRIKYNLICNIYRYANSMYFRRSQVTCTRRHRACEHRSFTAARKTLDCTALDMENNCSL